MTMTKIAPWAFGVQLLLAGTSAIMAQTARPVSPAGEYAQWCGRLDRNHIAEAKGLADSFDEISSSNSAGAPLRNVKWVAKLGQACFGSPVVAGGKVYLGGCLKGQGGDTALGLLWCFRESDGALLWKLRSQNIVGLHHNSWGMLSTPTVEGDRVYLLGQLGEVLCLNANGLANGNTGPFQDEEAWLATDRQVAKNEMTPEGRRVVEYSTGTPVKLEKTDADIIWRYDMVTQVCCWNWCGAAGAISIRGDDLYVPTCSDWNGGRSKAKWAQPLADWKTNHTGCPSPSLIVLDKKSGALRAMDETGAAATTYHGAHASPAWGRIRGKEMIVWAGGYGMCYGIDPNYTPGLDGKPGVLKTIWQFNCMKATNERKKIIGQGEMDASPVIDHDRVYVAVGQDLNPGVDKSPSGRLVCIDATRTGDITESGCIWKLDDFHFCAATVAIENGLLYTADAYGMVYCLDADTGQVYWTHKTASVWASPLVADGKVYVPTYGKGLLVFATGKEKKIIFESSAHSSMASSPAVAKGVLYFADQKYLYAVQAGASSLPPAK